MKLSKLIFSIALITTLAGCQHSFMKTDTAEPNLYDQSHEVVDKLISFAKKNSEFSGVNSNAVLIASSAKS
jgi:hypothetical protein